MVRQKIYLKKLEDQDLSYKLFNNSISEVKNMVKELTRYFTKAHVLLVVFSPSDHPLLFLGEFSDLTSIVEKFAATTTRVREKRRLDIINTLKANYTKADYNIDVEGLSNQWKQRRLESMNEQLRKLHETLECLENQKRVMENPKGINCMETLQDLETKLQNSLHVVRKCKNELNEMRSIQDRAIPGVSFNPNLLSGDNYLANENTLMMSIDQFKDALRNNHFAFV